MKDAVEVIKRATLASYEKARIDEDRCARKFLRAAAALGAAHRAVIRLEPRSGATASSWRGLLAVVSVASEGADASLLEVLSPERGYLAIYAGRARRSPPRRRGLVAGKRATA